LTRSRILTETGVPISSSGVEGVMGGSDFMSMGHAITRLRAGKSQTS
jgi:hypothetical protein